MESTLPNVGPPTGTEVGSAENNECAAKDGWALEINDIWKSFGSNVVSKGINFKLKKGEVLALLGENGAGKTTLMNIIFGIYAPDSGEVCVYGRPLKRRKPQDALRAGLGMVHQHFNLADNATVTENIILGSRALYKVSLRERSAKKKLKDLMDDTGLHVDQDKFVAELTVGEAQRVEILKALYRGARVLILDEPTAVLTPREVEGFFVILRTLVERGISVVFISHKLREVLEVSDRCIVLRKGQVVEDVATATATAERLSRMMLGRDVVLPSRVETTPGGVRVAIKDGNVSENGRAILKNCNVQLRSKEILGIAGVSGNGQNVLFDVIAGLRSLSQGQIEVNGEKVRSLTPRQAIQSGIGRVPEDRLAEGLMPNLTVWENAVAENVRSRQFQKAGLLRLSSIYAYTESMIERFKIKCTGPHAFGFQLSGGNLQKVLLGRTFDGAPRIILLNQPTRGLDVGAASLTHEHVLKAKEEGAAILLISEDLEELLRLSDRVAVMAGGRMSAPFDAKEVSMEKLGLLMSGEFHEENRRPAHAT